jgi:hypothetical protein
VSGSPPETGSGLSLFVTVRSGRVGVVVGVGVEVFVGVGVKVDVGVGVGVFVGVAVSVGVNVGVRVGVEVGVSVGVDVGVFVGVGVEVFVGVGVKVLVGVAVSVGVAVDVAVFVAVGVAVGASTVVLIVTELFDSLNSATRFSGSTVAVFDTDVSTPVVTEPLIWIVATAAGPVPNDPRSQSSVPPVVEPTMTQLPRVVENEL